MQVESYAIELSMQPDAGNDTWRRIFEQFDSIRIGQKAVS